MNKYFNPETLYQLPSGSAVHPCRLIVKDGTLMWKHALYLYNCVNLPESEACEQHIIKTAQRLEELNSWCNQDKEPWEGFEVYAWYSPVDTDLKDGISVWFTHPKISAAEIYTTLEPHVLDHEELGLRDEMVYFRRC